MRRILDAKHEKTDLNKDMAEKCQHLPHKQRENILQLLHKFEDFFDGQLSTWENAPVDL